MKSPILGESREITELEVAALDKLVSEAPVEVFIRLNRKFNSRGWAISIARLSDFDKSLVDK